MKRKNLIILFSTLLLIGLTGFVLQVFVFESPNGVLGFTMVLINIYLIFGSIIKLCKISEKFKNFLLEILDMLFCIR